MLISLTSLRTSAYEAINVLIQSGAQDTHQLIMAATPVFIERLEKTFAMQVLIPMKYRVFT